MRPELEAAFPGCGMMDRRGCGQIREREQGWGPRTWMDGWCQTTKADLMIMCGRGGDGISW